MSAITNELLPAAFDPDKLTPTELTLLRETVASGFGDSDIQRLLYLAKCYGLDPMREEIWLINRPNPQTGIQQGTVMTSRDGYLQVAQRHDDFEGLISFEVRDGDEFQIDAQGYTVLHRFGIHRGELVGAWAKCDRTGKKPFIAFAPFHEYFRRESSTWQQYPSAMIKKVAEVMVLKRAFSITGLVAREEIVDETGSGRTQPSKRHPMLRPQAPAYSVGRAIAQLQQFRSLKQLHDFEKGLVAYIAADSDFRKALKARYDELRQAIGPATTDQLVELRRLIDNQYISVEERFRMQCGMEAMSFSRAARAIGNLHETITFRARVEHEVTQACQEIQTLDNQRLEAYLDHLPAYVIQAPPFREALGQLGYERQSEAA